MERLSENFAQIENSRPGNVFVAGGAGYIGSVLCEMLLRSGWRVTIYDSFLFGESAIARIKNHPRLTLVRGDIRDTEKAASLLEPEMSVVHLASLSNDPSCDIDPDWSYQTNHLATVRLAESAKNAGGVRRFVFASSCSVYGHGNGSPLREDSPCRPVSLYAQLKLETESELLKLADGNFCPVILRQATVFGLSPRMRFDLAINQMTMHALTKGKIFIFGGGMQQRPFVHVRDTAALFKKTLEVEIKKLRGQVFNVGSTSNNFRIADLARRVKEEIGGVEIETIPEDPDKRDYNVDFSKIEKALGFKPQVDITEGVKEVADFVRQNPKRGYDTSEFFNVKRMLECLYASGKQA